jgi:type II secretory pathway pseudopilin PulG
MRKRRQRTGFTLIEVLVATAVTLLMMVSLAKIFKILGDSMQEGRAALELNNRLRNVALRIQNDLANATAVLEPPADPAQELGYFKYYDGPLTDYSGALYSSSAGVDLSRFGDTDDILMFTARADDVWYTGKVPLCILQGATPNAANTTEFVTIASQYAEIALFAEPVVSNLGNETKSPAALIADPNNYAAIGATDMPAEYRLHYRVLLIRPDLNLTDASVPGGQRLQGGTVGGQDWLIADPAEVLVGNTTFQLPSPTCDMSNSHQQCDLSLRRVSHLQSPSPVAANSLADLVDPANRFAHYRLRPTANTLSMPILALSPRIDMPYTASDAGSIAISNPPLPGEFQSGFLHPAFMLIGPAGSRVGEDVLANNILAFDVTGYDEGAPVVAFAGADGQPGVAGVDDDSDGNVDNASELGFDGSDDSILGPWDAGYGAAITNTSNPPVFVSTGAYVDLGWARKLQSHQFAVNQNNNLWSPLSGYGQANFVASNGNIPFTEALYKSGQVIQAGNNFSVLQPSYDSWSSLYEHDGILQAEPAARRGTVEIPVPANSPALRDGWRTMVDAASDGLDNNLNGQIDEVAERETLPPFASKLRGIKVSIRMEDPASRIIRQMSVGKEFITKQ